jgi:hypothetical protein
MMTPVSLSDPPAATACESPQLTDPPFPPRAENLTTQRENPLPSFPPTALAGFSCTVGVKKGEWLRPLWLLHRRGRGASGY